MSFLKIHQCALENARLASSGWHTRSLLFIKDDCGGQMNAYCLSLSTTAGATQTSLICAAKVAPSLITGTFVAKRYQNLGLLTA
jgi:hypothetical protein